MRRKRIVAVVATSMLLVGAGIAPAGEPAPNVVVNPNPVRQGKTLQIVAYDCVSGDGWTAYVSIQIVDAGENEKFYSYLPAHDSGTTATPVHVTKAKYPKGGYLVFVDCIHEFDDGGTGTWYETDTELKVKKKKRR